MIIRLLVIIEVLNLTLISLQRQCYNKKTKMNVIFMKYDVY